MRRKKQKPTPLAIPGLNLPQLDMPQIALPKIDVPGIDDDDAAPPDMVEFIECEVAKVESEFAKRNKSERKRFEEATDSEFWVAMCFQTRAQKEAFLTKLGLLDLGDKYLDGISVGERLGVTLERHTEERRQRPFSKKLLALVDDAMGGSDSVNGRR